MFSGSQLNWKGSTVLEFVYIRRTFTNERRPFSSFKLVKRCCFHSFLIWKESHPSKFRLEIQCAQNNSITPKVLIITPALISSFTKVPKVKQEARRWAFTVSAPISWNALKNKLNYLYFSFKEVENNVLIEQRHLDWKSCYLRNIWEQKF